MQTLPSPSSGKVDCVQDPVATMTNSAWTKVPSLHWIPIILRAPWQALSFDSLCRIKWETCFAGRIFPPRSSIFLKSRVRLFPASTHPPSRLRYPVQPSKAAAGTHGGKHVRMAFPLCNAWTLDPTAMSLLYASSVYVSPSFPVDRPKSRTPDLVKRKSDINVSR